MAARILNCGGKPLDLSRPCVMGILNRTPDSFSDGGRYAGLDAALEHAHRMVEEGADIIDVGGESTRPGSEPVSVDEELNRVLPLVERLAQEMPVPISVDTCKPEVMQAAAAVGAGMINDVMALRMPGALDAARDTGLPVCLMHLLGEPRTMQDNPSYQNVVKDVTDFLRDRVRRCVAAGLDRERLLIDPGFGFGKTVAHNLALLRNLDALADLDVPVLVGMSRKSMIGAVLDRPVDQRLYGGIAVSVLAVRSGASIVRVHDVAPTADALKMIEAVLSAPQYVRAE